MKVNIVNMYPNKPNELLYLNYVTWAAGSRIGCLFAHHVPCMKSRRSKKISDLENTLVITMWLLQAISYS